ncbi:MAG: hypothetical protein Q9169_008142, partial [Polycauliona sp. 2 TL-2023]
FWYHHYEKSVNADSGLNTLVLALFDRRQCFETWVCLYNMDDCAEKNFDFGRRLDGIPSPIYYASLLGLDWTVRTLLDEGADIDTVEEGGFYGTALQVASARGRETVVQLLLEEGANIHAHHARFDANHPNRFHGSTLHVASSRGHTKIVRMLLDKGAKANDGGEGISVALCAASRAGYTKIVRMLLDKGANVNDGGEGASAAVVRAASGWGCPETLRLLLESGANVNDVCGEHSVALVGACQRGYKEIVQILLEAGANVNDAREGRHGEALEAAIYMDCVEIVRMLLEAGADVNVPSAWLHKCSLLHNTRCSSSDEVVQLLLDYGAEDYFEIADSDVEEVEDSGNGEFEDERTRSRRFRGQHILDPTEKVVLTFYLEDVLRKTPPFFHHPLNPPSLPPIHTTTLYLHSTNPPPLAPVCVSNPRNSQVPDTITRSGPGKFPAKYGRKLAKIGYM